MTRSTLTASHPMASPATTSTSSARPATNPTPRPTSPATMTASASSSGHRPTPPPADFRWRRLSPTLNVEGDVTSITVPAGMDTFDGTVASDGDNFFVVWQEGDTVSRTLKAAHVNQYGTVSSPTLTLDAGALGEAHVAHAFDRYQVVWERGDDLFAAEIAGFDVTPITVTDTPSHAEAQPRIAYDPLSHRSLIVYALQTGGNQHLYSRVLVGGKVQDRVRISGTGSNLDPVQLAVSADPVNGGWIVTWKETDWKYIYSMGFGFNGERRGRSGGIRLGSLSIGLDRRRLRSPTPGDGTAFRRRAAASPTSSTTPASATTPPAPTTLTTTAHSPASAARTATPSNSTATKTRLRAAEPFRNRLRRHALVQGHVPDLRPVRGEQRPRYLARAATWPTAPSRSRTATSAPRWAAATPKPSAPRARTTPTARGTRSCTPSAKSSTDSGSTWMANSLSPAAATHPTLALATGCASAMAASGMAPIHRRHRRSHRLPTRAFRWRGPRRLPRRAGRLPLRRGRRRNIFENATHNGYTGECSHLGSGCPTAGLGGRAYASVDFDGGNDVIRTLNDTTTVAEYIYDFEGTVPAEWSQTDRTTTPRVGAVSSDALAMNPSPSTCPTCPATTILRSNSTCSSSAPGMEPTTGDNGPDYWEWSADGMRQLRTTFTNFDPPNNYQFYPDEPWTPSGVTIYGHLAGSSARDDLVLYPR